MLFLFLIFFDVILVIFVVMVLGVCLFLDVVIIGNWYLIK